MSVAQWLERLLFANVAACRAVFQPRSIRIFREKYCFSSLNIGILLDVVPFGKSLCFDMLLLTQM